MKLCKLWLDGLTFYNVFVLLAVAELYMTKTEERLSVTYPKPLRVTSIAQIL